MTSFKRGSLMTLLLLVMFLLIAFFSCSTCTTFCETKKTETWRTEATFKDMVGMLKELKDKAAGTRESIIVQFDENTAVMGFAKEKDTMQFTFKYPHGEERYTIPKPSDCGKDSCVCFCGNPHWRKGENPPQVECTGLTCTKGEEFGFLDISNSHSIEMQHLGGDVVSFDTPEIVDGFFIYRGNDADSSLMPVWGPKDALESYATLYLERVGKDRVAVCIEPVEGTCAAP